MRATIVPGVSTWSVWQPDRGMDFNGFYVAGDRGLVVDPIAPDEATLAELRERGVATIVVTNRDHERAAAAVRAATGAQIVASALDAPLLSIPVDRTVEPGDAIDGWTVVGFAGLKTPGEIALYDAERRTAIVGDAIWGTPAGALTLMPDAKLADPAAAACSLRALRTRPIEHLLVGDGACVFGGAYAALNAMFGARSGVALERINLDELDYRRSPEYPPPFGGAAAEAGRAIGAERLGYQVARIGRGEHFCPYHWHTAQEELFVVLAGAPTLRTPAGTFVLRRGDMVAFPVGARGAHRIWNDADEPALVLMLANEDAGDACFYPGSRKFVVEATDTLVRSEPQLDYWDGEGAPAGSGSRRTHARTE